MEGEIKKVYDPQKLITGMSFTSYNDQANQNNLECCSLVNNI